MYNTGSLGVVWLLVLYWFVLYVLPNNRLVNRMNKTIHLHTRLLCCRGLLFCSTNTYNTRSHTTPVCTCHTCSPVHHIIKSYYLVRHGVKTSTTQGVIQHQYVVHVKHVVLFIILSQVLLFGQTWSKNQYNTRSHTTPVCTCQTCSPVHHIIKSCYLVRAVQTHTTQGDWRSHTAPSMSMLINKPVFLVNRVKTNSDLWIYKPIIISKPYIMYNIPVLWNSWRLRVIPFLLLGFTFWVWTSISFYE